MTVKDLIEILSKQNPDAELTVTKKTWYADDLGKYFQHETDDFALVEISSTDKRVDFCY